MINNMDEFEFIIGGILFIGFIGFLVYIYNKRRLHARLKRDNSNTNSNTSLYAGQINAAEIIDEINGVSLPDDINFNSDHTISHNDPKIKHIQSEIDRLFNTEFYRIIYEYMYDNRDNLGNLYKIATYVTDLYKNNLRNPKQRVDYMFQLIDISMIIDLHDRDDILKKIWANVLPINSRNRDGIATIIETGMKEIREHEGTQYYDSSSNSDNNGENDRYKFLDKIK